GLIDTIENLHSRAEAVGKLASVAPHDKTGVLLSIVNTFADERRKLEALIPLSTNLPPAFSNEVFSQLVDILYKIDKDSVRRAKVLKEIAPYLPLALHYRVILEELWHLQASERSNVLNFISISE